MKFVVLALLFALVAIVAASDDWREGQLDPRCPAVDDPERAHTFAHTNCAWFWKCNGGWAFPMHCNPDGAATPLHYDASLGVCNWVAQANC